jgi:CRP/FNR family transcriptional regulator, cyclic AMP receptor protein
MPLAHRPIARTIVSAKATRDDLAVSSAEHHCAAPPSAPVANQAVTRRLSRGHAGDLAGEATSGPRGGQRRAAVPAQRRHQRPPQPLRAVAQLDLQLRERRPPVGTELGRQLMARVVNIPRGPFDPTPIVEDAEGWLGLLVLDGLVAVALDVGPAQTGWLVGDGDLIRPWDMGEISLTQESSWRALRPARVALLDRGFSRRAAGAPAISRAVVARTAQTTHWLLAESLITSAPVIEDRLLLLFALLAERWGRVRPEGVWLELPLTHDWLARLCGARRPSVSTALGSLGEEGLVECAHRGCWLLHGRPSPRRVRVWAENPCWRRYVNAIGFGVARDVGDQGVSDGAAGDSVRRLRLRRALGR